MTILPWASASPAEAREISASCVAPHQAAAPGAAGHVCIPASGPRDATMRMFIQHLQYADSQTESTLETLPSTDHATSSVARAAKDGPRELGNAVSSLGLRAGKVHIGLGHSASDDPGLQVTQYQLQWAEPLLLKV